MGMEVQVQDPSPTRGGGILHPNEKLPRPEPPPGLTPQSDAVSGDQEDGVSSIGRFIRQRSSVIARMIYRTEEEEERKEGGENDVVVREMELAGVKVIVEEKGSGMGHALKGRVTFFSRSNCRDCGAVRSFLRYNKPCLSFIYWYNLCLHIYNAVYL